MVPTEFATSLKVGMSIELRWTNCNRYYRANGVIVAINAKTLRARLTHDIPSENGNYRDAGDTIKVPLPYTNGYTQNNGVWPLTKPDSEHVANAEKEVAARRRLNRLVGEAIDRGRAERAQLEANSTPEALLATTEPIRIT